MADSSIEDLSASLIREYLFRKGLKGTLAKLDEELPRKEQSISNRTSLAKAVCIEKLMKKNKEDASPYRTMIEVIVKFLQTSDARKTRAFSLADSPNRVKSTTVVAELKGGVADPAPLVKSGSSGLAGTKLDLRGTSCSTSVSERGKFLKDLNVDTVAQERASNSLSHHGKPITMSPTSNPPTCESSHVAPHFDKSMSPHPDSWTGVGVSKGLKVEQKTHTNPSRQREAAKLVTVKPRVGRVLSHDGRISSGVAATTSGKGITRSSRTRVKMEQERSTASKDGQNCGWEEGKKTISDLKDSSSVVNNYQQLRNVSAQNFPRGRKFTGCDITKPGGQVQVPSSTTHSHSQHDDLLSFEDLEDIDMSPSLTYSSPHSHTTQPPLTEGTPIDLTTAKALRELIFGTATGPSFNAEWRRQNFVFCDVPKLQYGLIQHKGGPCGVLASVQAYILKHLLFSHSKEELASSLQPSESERDSVLVAALTDILWKAGSQKSATFALNSSGSLAAGERIFPKATSKYKPDGITEKLILHKFTTSSVLRKFINQALPILQDDSSSGCILFLYSLLLSRGVDKLFIRKLFDVLTTKPPSSPVCVRGDMDSHTTLLGAHGYCTQEIVNLMLTGFAVSNTFNGTRELDSGGKEKHVLRGPPHPSEVGLLSLFEHNNVCAVGTHLKNPIYPIWTISSESHFTVLFSLEELTSRKLKKFDLHYYDSLANQDEPIVLTVDVESQDHKSSLSASDLEPPLELIIKTKWGAACINWNGTEPLL